MVNSMEQTEQKDAVQQLREMRERNGRGMHISRIPERIFKEFAEWADAEFCSDRGMALKWLWEAHLDTVRLNARIEELSLRIEALERQKAEEKPKRKVVRMADGTVKALER
jgi:hypothetical protein